MALVADSGAIYALYDEGDAAHRAMAKAIAANRDEILIPQPALGEIDYLLRSRLGDRALLQFLEDLSAGAFRLVPVEPSDLERAAALARKFSGIDLGLCDASVAAIAERLGARAVLTVDKRDFSLLRTTAGKPFRLLP